MKTSKLLNKIARGEQAAFMTEGGDCSVVVTAYTSDQVKVYIGDGDADDDYQFLTATDLRNLAKKFKALAEGLDSGAFA